MSFSPGGNVPMLSGAPTCTVCGQELAWAGKGRRPVYCSRSCSSKAARGRERQRHEDALSAAAESTREETSLAPGDQRGKLLELGAALRALDSAFLLQLDRAAREGDGLLARQALSDVLDGAATLVVRHRELAERLLSEYVAQVPDLVDSARAPIDSSREENLARPRAGLIAVNPMPAISPGPWGAATGADAASISSRGKMWAVEDAATLPPISPRDETLALHGDGRAGLRDLVDRHLAQQAALWPGTITAPSSAPAGDTVIVPPEPMLRGLPTADLHIRLDPQVFGPSWKLVGWTVNPDLFLVTFEDQQIGWTERGLTGARDKWVAVYEGFFLGDVVTQEASLQETPEHAAHTVAVAYLQNL